ncbi:Uncharacterised protein [Mycobacterium tuberculosis]|uniref:Uncharacterized protein n=1 Tax=Mycobacterium tuberculosis TaxID=1773 RepID=A0A916PAL2_MYCTX|nr:Uncharacterised protein [Mycobacterium tuberculosis]COX07792.1 Uncharacterised protein [Mycobacterium tuberculosis]
MSDSSAAVRIASILLMPSGDCGSPLCRMINRAACPSEDRNDFMARWKSLFLKTSGGR